MSIESEHRKSENTEEHYDVYSSQQNGSLVLRSAATIVKFEL